VSGNDDELPRGSFDVGALERKIDFYQPRFLAFTSKAVGRAFCSPKTDFALAAAADGRHESLRAAVDRSERRMEVAADEGALAYVCRCGACAVAVLGSNRNVVAQMARRSKTGLP
jgi:hypothetical protein